jgi:excisionase family DNA binding protein
MSDAIDIGWCLSVAAAAEFLDVHPKTIRSLVERGELAAYQVGRVIKIPPSAIEALRIEPDGPVEPPPIRRRPRPVRGEFALLARELP